MTTKRTVDNVKLGAFVAAGLVFLVFSLYMIGKNQSLFGSTFTLMADFHNINGLTVGNNVRFSGIDVGTVKRIDIVSDSSVRVTMVIDDDLQKYIRKSALASVGTDGLMGNKLISIKAAPGDGPLVKDGDLIGTQRPVATDEMLQTLNTTNDNISVITGNLKEITSRLNSSNSLWRLLSDTTLVLDLKHTSRSIRRAGENAESMTRNAAIIVERMKEGDGPINTLFTDTTLSAKVRRSLSEMQQATVNLNHASRKLDESVGLIGQGKGLAGVALADTASANKLRRSLSNIEQGTGRFNENMEALQHHFLFRGYFKDKEKEMEKGKRKK